MKNKLKMNFLFIEFSFITFCILTCILIHNSKVEKDRRELQTQIDQFFQGKNLIFTGGITGNMGTLKDKIYHLNGGGFTILRVEKTNDEYIHSKIISGDIFYGNDNYKPNPETLYIDAFKYLLWGSYNNSSLGNTENTFNDMFWFGWSYHTKFHLLSYKSEKKFTGSYNLMSCSVSYSEKRTYFYIDTNKTEITKDLIFLILIGIVIATILTLTVFLLVKLLYPSINNENSLKNIKWKDIDSGIILLLEPKRFTTNKVTFIENDKVRRGVAKFSEKGTQLHISFLDSEFFYKIIKYNNEKLEVEDLNSNKYIYFEKLGSNAYK